MTGSKLNLLPLEELRSVDRFWADKLQAHMNHLRRLHRDTEAWNAGPTWDGGNRLLLDFHALLHEMHRLVSSAPPEWRRDSPEHAKAVEAIVTSAADAIWAHATCTAATFWGVYDDEDLEAIPDGAGLP